MHVNLLLVFRDMLLNRNEKSVLCWCFVLFYREVVGVVSLEREDEACQSS